MSKCSCSSEEKPKSPSVKEEVEKLQTMQPHSAMSYLSNTAIGAVLGGAVGYAFGAFMGRSKAGKVQDAMDAGMTVGLISFFENVAQDRKVRHIKQELDMREGHDKGR